MNDCDPLRGRCLYGCLYEVAQAAQRFRANEQSDLLRAWIVAEVESAIAAGRSTNHVMLTFQPRAETSSSAKQACSTLALCQDFLPSLLGSMT